MKSATFKEHLKHLKLVMDRIKEYNLSVNAEKTVLAVGRLHLLGHVVDADGKRAQPRSCSRSNYSELVAPLFLQTHKDRPFSWGSVEAKA